MIPRRKRRRKDRRASRRIEAFGAWLRAVVIEALLKDPNADCVTVRLPGTIHRVAINGTIRA